MLTVESAIEKTAASQHDEQSLDILSLALTRIVISSRYQAGWQGCMDYPHTSATQLLMTCDGEALRLENCCTMGFRGDEKLMAILVEVSRDATEWRLSVNQTTKRRR